MPAPRRGSPDLFDIDQRGQVSRAALAAGFFKIGMMGFGGVAPFARQVIVEERRWLSDTAYAEVLGVGQALPGANTVNAAVIIGDRFQGATGSVIAVLSLLTAPLCLLILAATAYDRFATLPAVQGALSGVAIAAAGLVIGTGAKMAWRLTREPITLGLAGAALIAVALFRAPLGLVVLALTPIGLGLFAKWGRR